MCKNLFPSWKKAVGLSVLFWVIMFAVITIVMFIPGVTEIWVVVADFVVAAVVGYCFSKWLFKASGNFGRGVIFGVVMLVIGTILDVIITVPLFLMPNGQGYGDMYGDWSIWVAYVIVLVFAGLGAGCKCKKMNGQAKTEEKVGVVETKNEDIVDMDR